MKISRFSRSEHQGPWAPRQSKERGHETRNQGGTMAPRSAGWRAGSRLAGGLVCPRAAQPEFALVASAAAALRSAIAGAASAGAAAATAAISIAPTVEPARSAIASVYAATGAALCPTAGPKCGAAELCAAEQRAAGVSGAAVPGAEHAPAH